MAQVISKRLYEDIIEATKEIIIEEALTAEFQISGYIAERFSSW